MRPIPPEPPSLRSPQALQERLDLASFYAEQANARAAYPKGFHAYRGPDVKDALMKAFHGKCAYCESPVDATHPIDVEHYRPKAAVVINRTITPPGYWWLASTWENLLPSCIDCNRARTQDFPGRLPAKAGKENKFPIVSEKARATGPGGEKAERRLLFHPYFDDPEHHLDYIWDQTRLTNGEVRPRRRGASNRPSRMGKVSIDVYGLQRLGLVKARRDRLTLLVSNLRAAEILYRVIPQHPELKAEFAGLVRDIREYTDESKPYSAMSRQIVAAFAKQMFMR